jgi:hypothetical protein
MHLAYCKKFTKTETDMLVEDVSFFCADQNQSQLLTYLSRYQNYMRNNDPDSYYMLCSITDLGSAVSTSVIQGLGVIELTRSKLEELKKSVVKNIASISDVMDAIKSAQIEHKDDDILLGFNLKYSKNDPTLHSMVTDLLSKHILDFISGPSLSPTWCLNEGRIGNKTFKHSSIEAPCYLVQHNNTFFLSKNVEEYTENV